MAIVICRQEFSLPDLLRAALLLVLQAVLALPAWADISLSMANIEHPALSAQGVRLQIGATSALLSAAKLRLLGREFATVRVECSQLTQQSGVIECARGSLSAAGLKEPLPLRFTLRGATLELEFRPAPGESWRLQRQGNGEMSVQVSGGRIERLQTLFGVPPEWKIAGRLDARFALSEHAINGKIQLREAAFSDAAGLHAAEKLAADLRLEARRQGQGWTWLTQGQWAQGEVFWQPLYAKADAQVINANGRWQGDRLEVSAARLHLPGVGDVNAGLDWSLASGTLRAAHLESAGLDLSKGGAAYLMPILAEHGVPEMRFAGHLSFSLHWDAQGLATVGVGLDDISLEEVRGRFAARGIRGGLPWLRAGPVDGYLSVQSAAAGDFKLGAFNLPLLIEPQKFSVAQAEIPLLDSKLVIERLVWRKSSKRQAWEGDLSLSLLPIPLASLTRAFGLPEMAGTLSASFPHLRYRDGAAYLDGALVIQVFEGYLNCTHLRLEDPFGTLPRLTADIDAQRLNLGQLTETFSFGRITGYADGEIKGLELAGWKPLKFDAKVMSSPGDYRKRISQRAVQNISSLGGAGAGAAIQATFLRVFEEFGYDKIGLSCRLRDGICTMGGAEDLPAGYVMVKGGGLPALSVIGYNRQVDWSELVSRLQGIIQNNIHPVIQ